VSPTVVSRAAEIRPAPATPAPLGIQPAAADEAPARKLRTLEEVRADLARLRETAKERHAQLQAQAQAQAQARRDTSFAPTDFMDFAPPARAPRDDAPSSFAPTAFFDLASLKAGV
jgi:hypothetical protein